LPDHHFRRYFTDACKPPNRSLSTPPPAFSSRKTHYPQP